jgi:hypothetical protein
MGKSGNIEAKKRVYSTIKHFDVEDGEYGV